MMAVSIKQEGLLLLEPPADFVTTTSQSERPKESLELSGAPETEAVEVEDVIKAGGPPADIELEKLPRPVSALNCRQARSYLVKLLRSANGGQNPQYGNPNSKPPFWPDYYWPWSKLTDVHTKPRGMEEPLLYSEMMKLAIQRGYKYYGYDPETYWDRVVEEKEPAPVERGTPAPILLHQVESIGLPPRLPRPNSKLNCVQARTVLSKLLRYQQAGNNPVYGHPETRPPWWPDQCIRWSDMVDLRGKPPYLPPDMTYTDVLKFAIDKGLKYFGYDAESWIDDAQYTREMNHSILSKKPVVSVTENPGDGPPRLPVPINKMNCGLARTSLSRLLRYHCGKNPKYGTLHSMPVWWPNDVFEWTALKNLSHRYDGVLGDSYSNCLRLAIVSGYEYYNKDPYSYVEEQGEDLPTVAAIKRVKLSVNPQVSKLIQQFDEDIADDPEESEDFEDDVELDTEVETKNNCFLKVESPDTKAITEKTKKPLPRLISLAELAEFGGKEEGETKQGKRRVRRKRPAGGQYGPLVSGRAHTPAGTLDRLKRCRVDVERMGLDLISDEPVSVSGSDLLNIAKAQCQENLFEKLKVSFDRADMFTDFEIVFTDGKLRVHKLVLAAASLHLQDLLADPTVDCLVFPDLSLAEGKMAVEALYSGDVRISPRSLGSLSSVERCLRRFQDVGLLENYSIQISALLPLSRFNSTKPQDVRPQSPMSPLTVPRSPMFPATGPQSPMSPPTVPQSPISPPAVPRSPSPLPPQSCSETVKEPGQDSKKKVEMEIFETEEERHDSKETETAAIPKKKNSPLKVESTRKDCSKPKFSEVSLEAVAERENVPPCEATRWLMEAGFLCSVPPRCRGCGEDTELRESSDMDSLAWRCPSKEKCPTGTSKPSLLREHSIFQYSKDKLLFIMKIILHWRENTSLSQCHLETGASVDQIFFWYEKCRQFFGPVLDDETLE